MAKNLKVGNKVKVSLGLPEPQYRGKIGVIKSITMKEEMLVYFSDKNLGGAYFKPHELEKLQREQQSQTGTTQ